MLLVVASADRMVEDRVYRTAEYKANRMVELYRMLVDKVYKMSVECKMVAYLAYKTLADKVN